MVSVIFLRAVNVGGTNRCRPATLAKQLAKFGVINIGTVGTFVVRENVSDSVLRAAIARKLPFKFEIMICPARDIKSSERFLLWIYPDETISSVKRIDLPVPAH